MEKCKKCGNKTENKGGFCNKCLTDESCEKLNECLGISEIRLNTISEFVAKMCANPKPEITPDLIDIIESNFSLKEKVLATYFYGLFYGDIKAHMQILKDFAKLFSDNPKLRKVF